MRYCPELALQVDAGEVRNRLRPAGQDVDCLGLRVGLSQGNDYDSRGSRRGSAESESPAVVKY